MCWLDNLLGCRWWYISISIAHCDAQNSILWSCYTNRALGSYNPTDAVIPAYYTSTPFGYRKKEK